ncbi:hypothetical protein L3X38_028370 [Prunus dulcis]|uniref:RRM domain-containing protein n=1 Tax=Prunus dulcis TaxID=3755 RepID=A0AAD4Z200_PRUDU|nr:hypothetical protein L3X38_028370 [Prunus dulcis]
MPYPRERRSASPHSSPSPVRGRRSRSLSRSRRSRSRSQSVDASNPGNNLYVTGLSTRVNSSDLEKFFNKEGKVLETLRQIFESFCACKVDYNCGKGKKEAREDTNPGRYQGLRDKRDAGRDHDRDRRRSQLLIILLPFKQVLRDTSRICSFIKKKGIKIGAWDLLLQK